jgi:hypothetical protein
MLFQHHRCVAISLWFCYVADFLFLSESTLVAKSFFSGFLCCVQVSSCFFLRLLVVSILIYFL